MAINFNVLKSEPARLTALSIMVISYVFLIVIFVIAYLNPQKLVILNMNPFGVAPFELALLLFCAPLVFVYAVNETKGREG